VLIREVEAARQSKDTSQPDQQSGRRVERIAAGTVEGNYAD
jgi:hypothetical protein